MPGEGTIASHLRKQHQRINKQALKVLASYKSQNSSWKIHRAFALTYKAKIKSF
jgi:hypothetical protein